MSSGTGFPSSPHEAALSASTGVPSRLRRRAVRRKEEELKLEKQLHTFDSLPAYLQDNEFIQTGYRYDLPVKDTLWSIFKLHNETGNVWSHLIGFIFFVVLTVWVFKSPPTPAIFAKPQVEELWHAITEHVHQILGSSVGDNLHHLQESFHKLPSLQHTLHSLQESVHSIPGSIHDSWQSSVHSIQESVQTFQGQMSLSSLVGRLHQVEQAILSCPGQILAAMARGIHWPVARWPMYVFCAGAMSCLLLSAVCHLFGCCKQHIALFIWRLDYAGIAMLIVSSFYPTVYYSFLCKPILAAVYLSVITVMGTCAVAMSLLERFQRAEWRSTRAGLYVSLGLMGIVPIVHVFSLHYDVWHVRTFVALDLVMGVCYLLGAFIYASRVPEKWAPGKFDILFHSHQIFHLFVVLGAYIHYRASLLLLEWRDASGGCAVPVTKPLNNMLEELAAHGHDLLHVDQVWEWLRAQLAQKLQIPGAAAAQGHLPNMTGLHQFSLGSQGGVSV